MKLLQIARIAAITALFSANLAANIIDGIALKVDGNIITMHEIQNLQKSANLSRDAAIEQLINDKLKDNEIKRLNIKVDDSRVNDEMNAIAVANKITRAELESAVKSQGLSLEQYKSDLKNHLINRDLMQKILQTNANIASEGDLRAFYEANKDDFKIPTKIKVTSYNSQSEADLENFLRNPMMLNPNIQSREEEIDIRTLPSQIAAIFIETPERKFTPLLNSGSTLIVFFIREKSGEEVLSFEEAQSMIIQKYSQARESEILNEYFTKIKVNSNIEIMR